MTQSYWLSKYQATFPFIYFQIWNIIANKMQIVPGLLHEISKRLSFIFRKRTLAFRVFSPGNDHVGKNLECICL